MPIPKELPLPLPPKTDYTKQSVAVPGTKKPGQTAHYRMSAFPLLTLESPGAVQNLVDLFESGLKLNPNANMLGHRPVVSKNPLTYADHFVWQSYGTIAVRRKAIGSALHKLFSEGVVGGGQLKTVGIWSKNVPNWQVIDLAVQAYHLVSVSLYDTLGKDAVEYIINHAETSIIFASSDHVPALLKLSEKTPVVKVIVIMDDIPQEAKSVLVSWGQEKGVKVYDFPELEAMGNANPVPIVEPSADTITTICYTSGTTGNPKGVVLTHGNLANAAQAYMYGLDMAPLKGSQPLTLSYLPLAHIFERVMELHLFAIGGAAAYGLGDPLRLLEDLQMSKPNALPSVPRVLNRIYQAGMAAGQLPGLKGALFQRALATKLHNLKTTGNHSHYFWDKLVFSKIQAVLGGQVKIIAVGSAPIASQAIEFLRVALSCDVIEGYGMTENCGTACRCWPGDPTSGGKVGAPQANTEWKLIDVPSMGYSSEDKPNPRGEICTRGDHCFKEYYKDEKNTKATVDEEGWVHTGDVGELDESGRFKIIDRVKNIMKLAQGEYVAVERIESLYCAAPIVAQLYLHGDSLQSYLIGVVIPDPVQLAQIASKVYATNVSPDDIATLSKAVQDAKVNELIMKQFDKEAKQNGLKSFEMIKRVHVSLEPFTVENGCMTPTLKLKRKDAYNKFKPELDALYALPEPTSSKNRL